MEEKSSAPIHEGLGIDILNLRLTSSFSEELVAVIYPNELRGTSSNLSATVCWESGAAIASVVGSNDAESEPWSRCLQLMWMVLSPGNVPNSNRQCFEHWRELTVSVPNMSKPVDAPRLRLVLDRARWTSALIDNDGERVLLSRGIPPSLRALDAGSLLVNMAAQLLEESKQA